ncbi:MAG TPA: hypothetical protein VE978_25570 [Chitinophagales bacterium]|nr:hypothetical protein [Chitinophagales bacterium]
MQLSFSIRLSVLLFFAFIVATIVGTVSHESGHYLMAKALGYNARIYYDYTTWDDPKSADFIDSVNSKYREQILEGQDFPGKEKYNQIIEKHSEDDFWIGLGGPLQTMLTGTIGLLLLFLYRKSFYSREQLTFRQWVLVFVSLFWLRQTANFFALIGSYVINGKLSVCSDEIRLEQSLQLPGLTISALTGIIGAVILTIVIFKFIPAMQRMTFILSGITGGMTGYFLWLVLPARI